MKDWIAKFLYSYYCLFLSIAFAISGIVVMFATESFRHVRFLSPGKVIPYPHFWDLISLPLLLGGITLLFIWDMLRQKPK